MANTQPPSLYTWAGGAEIFERLLTRFYDRVREDAMLAPVFAHMYPAHAQYVAQFIAEVFGGPTAYSAANAADGGHAHMIARHLDRQLTEAQRRHWINLLLDCADEIGIPDDPEFRSAFVGYLEWGSRLAVLNSQPGGSAPSADSPMPTWGWGEVKGPYRGD